MNAGRSAASVLAAWRAPLAWLLTWLVTSLAAGWSGPLSAAPSYERDITPILRTYCSGCHNDADREGGLSVETFASLRKGGDESGDPIAVGDAGKSVLIRRIRSTDGDHMPPADEPQLPAAELATLEAWIAAGAAGPARDTSLLASLTVPTLTPHAGRKPVTAAAVSPDGRRLAVARGRSIELHDAAAVGTAAAAEPPAVATIGPLGGNVAAIHWTADGSRLVVATGIAGLMGAAEIRDARTGAVLRSFGGADSSGRHRDMLFDAELSPDGSMLATVGYDRSIKLWNAADGSFIRSIDVHNGAVFDVAWHPSGRLFATASGDETVKLWRTADGARLDTLSQPQGDVCAVAFTPDGQHVVAAGRDKRIHLWKLVSAEKPGINPPVHARFAHEAPIVAFAISPDGRHLLTAAEDRSLKGWSLPDLALEHVYPAQPDVVAAVVPRAAGFIVGRMDGGIDSVAVVVDAAPARVAGATPLPPARAPASPPASPPKPVAAVEHEPNDDTATANAIVLPAAIRGEIERPGDADGFRFTAKAGERFLLEVNAARSGSKLDSRIEVLDGAGRPIEQAVLQATRDSWFTFRGKNSSQVDDFRVHNWMEMELDEYLYAGGEVVKLWMYPDGPDAGFIVYPGEGNRHTFFETSAVTHALGEPAWIVSPLPTGVAPAANGLPVFTLYYENDDDSQRRLGADSRLMFTPPEDGEYVARIVDVRGFGGGGKPGEYRYELTVREPRPGFSVNVGGKDPKVSPGSGRELVFTVERSEGFEGPVRIEVAGMPPGFTVHGPIEIEAGQRKAIAVISAAADAAAPDEAADKRVKVVAKAMVEGRGVVQDLGTLGDIQLAALPKVAISIESGSLTIRPGQTISTKVKAVRNGFDGRIEMGRRDAGRNLPHGVFVDNVGLNGLLIVEGQDEREFFITASPIAKPGTRLFHLRTTADGGQASLPIVLTIVR